MNKQLQNKINSIQNQVVELEIFQAQVLEIHTKIEKEQQGVFFKLEFIQNYFQETSKSLEKYSPERERSESSQNNFSKSSGSQC
jgi:hypothetical protein